MATEVDSLGVYMLELGKVVVGGDDVVDFAEEAFDMAGVVGGSAA